MHGPLSVRLKTLVIVFFFIIQKARLISSILHEALSPIHSNISAPSLYICINICNKYVLQCNTYISLCIHHNSQKSCNFCFMPALIYVIQRPLVNAILHSLNFFFFIDFSNYRKSVLPYACLHG